MAEASLERRPHRLAWSALGVLCAWSAWRGAAVALRPGAASDFRIYWECGRAVVEGRDPFDVVGFIYLPGFAVAMAPFAALPFPLALVLWQALSLAAVFASARLCARLAVADGREARPWIGWAALLCVLRLVDSNLGNGQVNAFVFLLLLLGVAAWIDGRERAGGLWIGLAAAAKIVPACLLLAMVARRAWRAAAATIASGLVFALLLPASVLGWTATRSALEAWWRREVRPYAAGGSTLLAARPHPPGQSLSAVAYGRLADLDPDVVAWIVRGAQAMYLVVLVATLARLQRRRPGTSRLEQIALVLVVALTLAPLVHKAHLLWLMLPYAVLLAGPAAPLAPFARRARSVFLGLSVLLVGATSPALLGRWLATWSAAHHLIFLGMQCVLAALLVDAWCAPAADARRGTVRGP